MKTFKRSEAGMAMLETALVLPVLLLVIFGIVETGLGFARFQVVLNAAREGARAAAIFSRSRCEVGNVRTAATTAVNSFQGSLGMASFAITTTPIGQGDLCTARMVAVSVQFDHQVPLTNGLGRLFGSPGPLVVPITAQSAATVEGNSQP